MAYRAITQMEEHARRSLSPELASSPVSAPRLSWEADGDEDGDGDGDGDGDRRHRARSFTLTTSQSKGAAGGSYDLVEGDDFAADAPSSPGAALDHHHRQKDQEKHDSSAVSDPYPPLHLSQPRPPPPISRPQPRPTNRSSATNDTAVRSSTSPKPIIRTASGRRAVLRHPTPDLQVLQGAYTGNVEHLERTAERLSMTSSIDHAIKELHHEQKRAESRSQSRKASLVSLPEAAGISRKVSNASSIVEVNSTARSGGFSPAGVVISPHGSFTAGVAGSLRSVAKSSRFRTRPEPELEGRPLDSFVNMTASTRSTSPALSTSAPLNDVNENAATLTLPVVDMLDSSNNAPAEGQTPDSPVEYRPATSASTNIYDLGQAVFEGFDGVHTDLQLQQQPQILEPVDELGDPDNSQRRLSSANRLSMARPQTYADPDTGQNMVYYPAPVPMMLNLPHRLSKAPSSTVRNKKRAEVLSNIPPTARQSAIWLPDVLEDGPSTPEDEETQQQEYVPQHQRMTMGGRRNTRDLEHLPPQLRASTFFDLPAPAETVEMKEQSAVATLDSILDASAHAPVGAFTDHTFAGHLGAEVYGRPTAKPNRSSTQLLDKQPKKRRSSFGLLGGKRNTHLLDLDKENNRPATMSEIQDAGKIAPRIESDDDETSKDTAPLNHSEADEGYDVAAGDEYAVQGESGDEEDQEEAEGDIYHGPPTTLLAELQLRKQQQKHRTRPLVSAYPNGMHSTLLQLDAVAQVEQRSRKQKRVNLAWEATPDEELDEEGEDEDIPLAMLYSQKLQEVNRPLGLMERRELEDNEPLSRRRERLTGRPAAPPRASTMMNIPTMVEPEQEDEVEGETLAQRIRRLKEKEGTVTGLPAARPVSGDFASEMMSQFGGDLLDTKGKNQLTVPSPDEETLGQRRKRLQAEREAQARQSGGVGDARLALNQRHTMADILRAVPSNNAGMAVSQNKPAGGLLGLYDREMAKRSSTLLNLDFNMPAEPQRNTASGFKSGQYNDGQGGIIPQQAPQPNMYGYNPPFQQPVGGINGFQQPIMPFSNSYAMGFPPNPMQMGFNMQPNPMMNMGMGAAGVQPLNQKQIDMVERWRQSVMQ